MKYSPSLLKLDVEDENVPDKASDVEPFILNGKSYKVVGRYVLEHDENEEEVHVPSDWNLWNPRKYVLCIFHNSGTSLKDTSIIQRTILSVPRVQSIIMRSYCNVNLHVTTNGGPILVFKMYVFHSRN